MSTSKARDKIITVRVDEDMYNTVKKMAGNSRQSLSEYVVRMLELFFDQNNRTDLLIRNMHEEILQLEDMITLMQGFNMEVYTTLLARTSKHMDAAEKRDMQEYRKKALDGLQGYLDKVSQKIIAGENIWHKETKEITAKILSNQRSWQC